MFIGIGVVNEQQWRPSAVRSFRPSQPAEDNENNRQHEDGETCPTVAVTTSKRSALLDMSCICRGLQLASFQRYFSTIEVLQMPCFRAVAELCQFCGANEFLLHQFASCSGDKISLWRLVQTRKGINEILRSSCSTQANPQSQQVDDNCNP